MTRFRTRATALTVLALVALAALSGPIAIALASIDGTCSIQMQINDRRQVGLTKSVNIGISPTPSVTFTDGAGASSANQLYQASRTMSGGADSIDLIGSTAKDGYGDNLAMVRLKAIYLKNTSTHTETFFGGTTPIVGPTDTLVLPPGAFVLLVSPDATGWVVTATTADLLNATGTTTDTYDIAILGAKT